MATRTKEKPRKQALEGKRLNAFSLDPNDLTIVGLDCPAADDAAVDERIKLEPSDSLVKSILRKGILQPVIVSKEDGKVIVLAGRQRVRAARAANLILENEGSENRIMVPCIVRRGEDEVGVLEIMIMDNEQRREDSPLNKAKKAARLLARNGGDEALTADAFGVSKQTIKNWLSLLEASSAVKVAVDRGTISPTAGYELARLPKEDQGKALEEVKEKGGKVTTREITRQSQRARNVRSVSTRPTLREIKEVIEEKRVSPAKVMALRWVLGEIETAEFLGMEVES